MWYCGFSCWSEVWDQMSQDCQAAVLTISCPKFEETLSSYLTKHRWVRLMDWACFNLTFHV